MNFSASRQLPLALDEEDASFVLDGRLVRFPEGLRTAELTHTIHRFPGKFVPQVARELIRLAGGGQGAGPICDPFCGSGTMLVEAAALGIESLGLDFDPLGALISKVKTTPLSVNELETLATHWRWAIPDEGPDLAPDVPNLYHWFAPRHVAQLSAIKAHCLNLPERLRSFSLVVFSSILRRVSNADDQTQKTYVSGTLPKRPPQPRELFPVMLTRAMAGMRDFRAACLVQPRVIRGDARFTIGAETVRGVATSPPYLDSIDYVYNQMLEYFWLHAELGIQHPSDIKKLRSQPVGFSRGALNEIVAEIGVLSPELAGALSPDLAEIGRTSRKEAEHVGGYFRDYAQHLKVCCDAIPSGGRYALAVGESVVRGRRITTPELLITLFEATGFGLVGRCSYEIRRHYMKFPRRSNSGTIKVDHILCFEKR